MRGRAGVGRGSLLAVRPVHAREGGCGERGSAGDETLSMRGRAGVARGERGVWWR